MSILKPVEETVDISSKEIKELIAYDLGIHPEHIDINVKVEHSNGVSFFNDSPIEKATALIATVTLPGKTQKFEIYEKDLKEVLKTCLQQNFEDNVLIFNYQKDQHGSNYELLSVSVAKKPENTHSQDLLMDSLTNMQNLVQNIQIQPQSLDEMSRTIDSLEDSINKARDTMRRKF